MKVKSPAFRSQCQVLNFPWMGKRTRRSKAVTGDQAMYSQVLTFQPPSLSMTPATNDITFPLIQMMNGKEPVVWEETSSDSSQKVADPMGGGGGTTMGVSGRVTGGTTSAASAAGVLNGGGAGSASSASSAGSTGSAGSAGNGGAASGGKCKNRIPRPKNAFILYRSHVSQMLKEAMAFKVRESNISSLVSEMWKKESDVVHAYYAKRAALEWVQYMKRLQQQDRCTQGTYGSETRSSRSPTPPAVTQQAVAAPAATTSVLSPLVMPSNVPSLCQLSSSFSSMSPSPVDEKKPLTIPFSTDSFISNAVYGSSPDATRMGLTGTDTSTLLSSSPRSSNEDFLDSSYAFGGTMHLEKPVYPLAEKTYSSSSLLPSLTTTSTPSFCSFKDSTFFVPYDMNSLDMGYGYMMPNPSTFSTHSYPYVVNTNLGLDTGIRWPEWMSTPTAWPVPMI